MARIVNGQEDEHGHPIQSIRLTVLELALLGALYTLLIGLGAWNLLETVSNGRWIAAHDIWSKQRSEEIDRQIKAEAEARRVLESQIDHRKR